jgi:hypothetical protein
MRSRSSETVALILCASLQGACKKKEEAVEEVPVPQRNAATLDVVNTEIGTGLALKSDIAPTSVRWERVVVLDEERAVLLGRDNDGAWAIRTSDRGRTWTSLNAPAKAWASWGLGGDGTLALTTGARDRAEAPAASQGARAQRTRPEPIIDASIWFAGPGDQQLNGPLTFFPDEDKLKSVTIPSGIASPALSEGTASLLAERNREAALIFAASAGSAVPEPIGLPKGSFVPIPYGRPAKLLSVDKGTVELRNWPKAGEPLGAASALPNFRGDAQTFAQLSEGPSCEWGNFSFRRIAGTQPWLLGISGDRALAFKLPPSDAVRIGCTADAVITETTTLDPTDPTKKRKVPQLVRCSVDGKCSDPKAPPFAIWNDKHDRDIWAVPSNTGMVAVLRARAGTRWGLYLGQSNDGGVSYELPRTIGEGKQDRGFLDIGAIIRFPQRLVLLVSADVGSTGRRGWYALASDDDGNNWGPP